ncbi:hypothetical protein BKA93DRAFT_750312 [Sparassis latifolia]
MDISVILHKYTLAKALLHIEIFTEPFDLILWKAWAIRMHVLLVFMVQAQSEAASVGIILPLSCDISILAQVKIHLAMARTIEVDRRMIPQIADHLPACLAWVFHGSAMGLYGSGPIMGIPWIAVWES